MESTRSGRVPKKSLKRQALDATKTVKSFLKRKKTLPESNDSDDNDFYAQATVGDSTPASTWDDSTTSARTFATKEVIDIPDSSAESSEEDENAEIGA